MNKVRNLLIIVSIALLVVLAGCSKKECESSSDCTPSVCETATCVASKCNYFPVKNCCGNKIEEPTENGKPGSKCTCPQDYGACEGKPQVLVGKRLVDAKYLDQYCDENNQCLLGVPPEKVKPVTLLDERNLGLFELQTTANYNEPFDVSKDIFTFRFTVTDDDEDLVFPVRLTKMLLTDGEIIIADRDLSNLLGGVGDTTTVSIPASIILAQPEEEHRLTMKINYEFNQQVKIGRYQNGSPEYEVQLERKDFSKRFATKINFVQSKE